MKIKTIAFILLMLLAAIAAFTSCHRKEVPQKVDVTITTPAIDTTVNIGDTVDHALIDSCIDAIPVYNKADSTKKVIIKQAIRKELKGAVKINKETKIQSGGLTATIAPGENGKPATLHIQQPEKKQTFTLEAEIPPVPQKPSFWQELKSILWVIILLIVVTGIVIIIAKKDWIDK